MWEFASFGLAVAGIFATWAWRLPEHFQTNVGKLHWLAFSALAGIWGYTAGYKAGADSGLSVTYADTFFASIGMTAPVVAFYALIMIAEFIIAANSPHRKPVATKASESPPATKL